MAEWLKGCEICDAGLCARVDELVGQGMSERKASKVLEDDQQEQLGEVLYPWNALRVRYQRIKGGTVRATPPTTCNLPETPDNQGAEPKHGGKREGAGPPLKYEKAAPPWSCAMQMAGLAIDQLERIPTDDPKRQDAFQKVMLWIKENR